MQPSAIYIFIECQLVALFMMAMKKELSSVLNRT